MNDPRTTAAVLAARTAGIASRRLGRGGGTALPGLVAERLQPRIVARLARTLGRGRAIVTGTNGKTTTAHMLAAILRADGRDPVHNRSGSNLMRGLAATLAAQVGPAGSIPNSARRAGVFEVDEATTPRAGIAIRPDVFVMTNLFRDQLDRYGEVDSITGIWRRTLARLPASSTVAVNADDPSVATVAGGFKGRVLSFGVEDPAPAQGTEHAADSRWCGRCGTEYAYTLTYFWHIGHWRCPGCDLSRPAPDVAAERIAFHPEHSTVTIRTPEGNLTLDLPLTGLYNVYNALAATTGALALGVPLTTIAAGIGGVAAAFGRQEEIRVRGRTVRLLLCKNPAGVNQVLRTLLDDPEPLSLLLILNDGIADGRDVSWIWDVDYEQLNGRARFLLASGDRAADMALRLRYAGLPAPAIEPLIRRAAARAVAATPPGGRLYVLPTYTAMLQAREWFARAAGQRRFWEE